MRMPLAAAAAWLLTRTVILLMVLGVVTLPGPDVTTDVTVIYQGWYEVLRTGSFPLGDVTWQYPPAAGLAILAPGALPFLDYTTAFFVVVCAADAVVCVLLLAAGRRSQGRTAGAWCWVVGLPLLGPTAYSRYDVLVAVFAVAGLLALTRRPAVGGALIGFGAMLKAWPVLLLVGSSRGRGTRVSWSVAAAVAAATAAVFAATMPGAFDFLTYQRERGTEVESLGSLVFHLARHFGWEGQVLLHYGSVEFLGPYVPVVSNAALVLSALAFGWLVLWRLRARHWESATPADAAFVAVLLFVTTSRVLSPQYMVWLVALAAVCVTLRTSHMAVPAAMVVAATAVTLLEFPVWFGEVVASTPLGVALLVVRNGLLVAAAFLACRNLWRATVTGPGYSPLADTTGADRRIPARHGPRTPVSFPSAPRTASAERDAAAG